MNAGSGYGPTEEGMAVRITRSAGNSMCDFAWRLSGARRSGLKRIADRIRARRER